MYKKTIAYRDYNDKPRNETVLLNLEVREVTKLLVEFNSVFKWLDSNNKDEFRELSTEEVVEFFNNLETILLSAWGELDNDGKHFRKVNRYNFEESKLFAATMELFVSDPSEAVKMVNELMPKGMEELARKAEGNLEKLKDLPGGSDAANARIEELQRQLEEERQRTSASEQA